MKEERLVDKYDKNVYQPFVDFYKECKETFIFPI